MSHRRVTIHDVARSAGVSTTTVSAALNGNGRISDETRRRVLEAAEGCGYVASAAARSLRLGRSGALGLYVPIRTVGYEYYVHVARGAAEAALGSGFALTLLPAWRETTSLRALHLDGVIACDPAIDDPVVATLRSLPVPMVTLEEDPDPTATPAGVVLSDHRAGMATLLDHLADRGATSVAVLAPGDETTFGRQVREACLESARDVRLVDAPLIYTHTDVTRAVTTACADAPDALVVVPDGAAVHALRALQDQGLRVPDDLLLASYVDGPSARLARPAITAIDLDPRLAGEKAVTTLVDLVLADQPTRTTAVVPTRLRVRASTRGAAVGAGRP